MTAGAGDTYPRPPHGWTCFHCGETFMTLGGAADHFGSTPDRVPGCRIKVGEERGLLMEIRRLEAELLKVTDQRDRALEAVGRMTRGLLAS